MQKTPFHLRWGNRMRPVKSSSIIFFTVLFFLLTSISFAELPELPSVPGGLNEHIALKLNRSRSELEKTRIQLNQEIIQFDAKCVNRVRDGDFLVEECSRWEQDLQNRVNNFSKQFNEFRREIKRAEDAEVLGAGKLQSRDVPSPEIPIVAVIKSLKGTVEMKTSKGWVPVDKSSKFLPGTELRAGPDGYAKILIKRKRLQNGTFTPDVDVILKPNSGYIFAVPGEKKSVQDKLKDLLKHPLEKENPGSKAAQTSTRS